MASRKLAVVVTGGRHYGKKKSEREAVYAALDKAAPSVVLHGGASGADTIASEWCKLRGVWQVEYPADWSLGKAAGPMRNGRMCDDLKLYVADGYRIGVVAFPGGAGTASCIRHADRRGIKVWQPVTCADEERFEKAPAMADDELAEVA
jgi:hypothetical protein